MTSRTIWAVATMVALLIVALIFTLKPEPAAAADLGGNCCSDLEDRIAELEATTAKKGNRKISLTVYGQVNAGIVHLDAGDYDDTNVTQNGVEETFFGFRGMGRVSKDVTAGYVLEIDVHQRGLIGVDEIGGNPTLAVRQSFAYVKSETLGSVAVGKVSQATNDFDKINTSNAAVASKPLSLQPISDLYLTGLDLPFDGGYRNIVRYQTPTWSGVSASVSYGSAFDVLDSEGNGATWDAAIRYVGEAGGFAFAGGLGYRHDTDLRIDVLDITSVTIGTGDVETKLAAGSIKHLQTGLFVTGNWSDQDWKDLDFKLKGWNAQGGIERNWFGIGATTLYGEYGVVSLEDVDVDIYGAGVVQALDGAATDLYIAYKQYDLDDLGADENVKTYTLGARVKF